MFLQSKMPQNSLLLHAIERTFDSGYLTPEDLGRCAAVSKYIKLQSYMAKYVSDGYLYLGGKFVGNFTAKNVYDILYILFLKSTLDLFF